MSHNVPVYIVCDCLYSPPNMGDIRGVFTVRQVADEFAAVANQETNTKEYQVLIYNLDEFSHFKEGQYTYEKAHSPLPPPKAHS